MAMRLAEAYGVEIADLPLVVPFMHLLDHRLLSQGQCRFVAGPITTSDTSPESDDEVRVFRYVVKVDFAVQLG